MPTQYRSDLKTLTRHKVRYEVGLLADQLTPSGIVTDAFGRLRNSEPFTIFDSTSVYSDNGNKWTTSSTGTGYKTDLFSESAIKIGCIAENGIGTSIRQTKRNFVYQPGKSLLVLNSFLFSPNTQVDANITQRIGYFNENNGIYLQQKNGIISIVLRTNTSGNVEETIVNQSNWNVDTFGTNPNTDYSGVTLDVTKANVFWIDMEWLGVGNVRCGFMVDGKLLPAHIFYNDNRKTGVYMKTANLPIRIEVNCPLTVGENATIDDVYIKQFCNSVISEGGYEPRGIIHNQQTGTINTFREVDTKGTFYNAISIRLKSTAIEHIVIPQGIQLLGDSNNVYQWMLIKNATIDAGSSLTNWTAFNANSAIEYCVDNVIILSGQIVKTGFFTSDTGSDDVSGIDDLSLQIGKTLAGVSDIYTLAVTGGANDAKYIANISWYEIL